MADTRHPAADAAADKWTWRGDRLTDGRGDVIARVFAGVIHTAGERILVERSAGGLRFRCRATLSHGEMYTVVQRGLSTHRLIGYCDGYRYQIRRTGLLSVERDIVSEAGVVAHTRPDRRGSLDIVDGPEHAQLPMLHGIVLSWACYVVDVGENNTRI